MRYLLLMGLLGCGGNSYEGQLVDGMTGQALLGVRVLATASSDDASMTCMTFDGTTDANGDFKMTGLCAGVPYALSTDQDTLWLADIDHIPASGVPEKQVLQAWRAPAGGGLFELSGGRLDTIRSSAELKIEKVRDSEVTFTYPSEIPPDSRIALIEAGEHLVFGGKEIEQYTFKTLNDVIEPVKIGTTKQPYTLSNIATVGVAFTDATTMEPRPAPGVNASRLSELAKGDRSVRYMSHDALPPGRYLLSKEGEERIYLVDFVKRPPPPPPLQAP